MTTFAFPGSVNRKGPTRSKTDHHPRFKWTYIHTSKPFLLNMLNAMALENAQPHIATLYAAIHCSSS